MQDSDAIEAELGPVGVGSASPAQAGCAAARVRKMGPARAVVGDQTHEGARRHAHDFPSIAEKGLAAAICYGDIAPSAPRALHMPSHIFTRGLLVHLWIPKFAPEDVAK
jgi:hypothetical protein